MNDTLFDSLVEKWAGTPFSAGGRSTHGVDCAWLCILFLREYLEQSGSSKRFVLPSRFEERYDSHFYLRGFRTSKMKEICQLQSGLLTEVTRAPRKGDICLFQQGSCPGSHAAIAISDTQILESRWGSMVQKSELSNMTETLNSVFEVDYQ